MAHAPGPGAPIRPPALLQRVALALVAAAGLAIFLALPDLSRSTTRSTRCCGRGSCGRARARASTPTARRPSIRCCSRSGWRSRRSATRARAVRALLGVLVALVAAVWRLGRAAAGLLGGVLAAALIASRLNLPLLASIGFLDIPYCALIAWAWCSRSSARGAAGRCWCCSALAGLLRPEAWLLAGAVRAVDRAAALAARARARCPRRAGAVDGASTSRSPATRCSRCCTPTRSRSSCSASARWRRSVLIGAAARRDPQVAGARAGGVAALALACAGGGAPLARAAPRWSP